MKTSRLFPLTLVLILLVTLTGAAGSTPLSGPCVPGAAYDPACDVDHDGDVDIFDIQLTAGHWDQTGTWTGGDSWLLTGNAGTDPMNNFLGTTDAQPLVIQPGDGNVGIGTIAPQSKLSVNGTGWFQGSSTPLPAAAGEGVGIGYVPAWQAGYLFAFDYSTFTPRNLWLQSPGGKVGIGTAPTSGKLQVAASAGEDGVHVDSAGNNGLFVNSATNTGVYVGSVGSHGVYVSQAGSTGIGSGVYVYRAGNPTLTNPSNGSHGFQVAGTAGSGLVVGHADEDGVYVGSATGSGMYVGSTSGSGFIVGSALYRGVDVGAAGTTGVYADTTQASGQWGFYTPDAIHGSNVLMHSLSLVAQVTGPDSVTSGDIVAVAGIADPVPGSTVHTPLVRLAGGSFTNVVGVVESHLALTPQPSRPQAAEGKTPTETPVSELRSVEGPAQPGDYVAITVLGAAQVKVANATPIAAGQRLTVAPDGRARPLGTLKVQLAGDAGMADLPESAPVIGVAMEAAKDGLVWVLVNPQ